MEATLKKLSQNIPCQALSYSEVIAINQVSQRKDRSTFYVATEQSDVKLKERQRNSASKGKLYSLIFNHKTQRTLLVVA